MVSINTGHKSHVWRAKKGIHCRQGESDRG